MAWGIWHPAGVKTGVCNMHKNIHSSLCNIFSKKACKLSVTVVSYNHSKGKRTEQKRKTRKGKKGRYYEYDNKNRQSQQQRTVHD